VPKPARGHKQKTSRKNSAISGTPLKQELARLKTEKEPQQVTIEKAVALYTADMVVRLGKNGTVQMARSLLGHVDPKTHEVTNPGHLFGWLEKIPTCCAIPCCLEFTAWRATARVQNVGPGNPVTTATAYLPWVKELEQSTIAEGRAALKRAEPKPTGRKVVYIIKREVVGKFPVTAFERSRWRDGRFACYAPHVMLQGRAFNCDFRFSLIFLNQAKSAGCKRKKIQFP
jgi:hypothetical protein